MTTTAIEHDEFGAVIGCNCAICESLRGMAALDTLPHEQNATTGTQDAARGIGATKEQWA